VCTVHVAYWAKLAFSCCLAYTSKDCMRELIYRWWRQPQPGDTGQSINQSRQRTWHVTTVDSQSQPSTTFWRHRWRHGFVGCCGTVRGSAVLRSCDFDLWFHGLSPVRLGVVAGHCGRRYVIGQFLRPITSQTALQQQQPPGR